MKVYLSQIIIDNLQQLHQQVSLRPCLALNAVVDLIAHFYKNSKNTLIEVEELIQLFSKDKKHNSDVDKYRNKSESLQNVTAFGLMILLLGLSTNWHTPVYSTSFLLILFHFLLFQLQ